MKLWIIRDFNNSLKLYVNKPVLGDDMFYYDSKNMKNGYLSIDKNLFPEVTFKNSPQKVEIKLVKKNGK